MKIELYETKTHTPLEAIKGVRAASLETINAEIQVLNIRDAAGKLRGREIDGTRTSIHITQD